MGSFEFDVAISFAGEDRDFARSLALSLEDANYSIFYDEFEVSRLWGTELSASLAEVYGNSSRYCIVLISKYYAAKPWTNHERRFAIQRALNDRPDYILPIRLDGTDLPGWPSSMAYLSTDRMSLAEITSATLAKVGPPEAVRTQSVSPQDRTLGEQLLQASFRRALFTRMDSEINLDAMANSLGECIGQIQQLVPRFESPELQNLGIQLLALLDDIQRRCVRSEGVALTMQLPDKTKLTIDGQKLAAIQLLKRLRRRINASLQFPTDLVFDHFFRIDEGREPPSASAMNFHKLTVQQHLAVIQEHMEGEVDTDSLMRRMGYDRQPRGNKGKGDADDDHH